MGVIKGPIPLHFCGEVVVNLQELKVIQHTKTLVLIGADVLSAGNQGWSFQYIGVVLDGHGLISFAQGRKTQTLPLLRALHLANLSLPPMPTMQLSSLVPQKPPQLAAQTIEKDPKLSKLIAMVKGQGWCP